MEQDSARASKTGAPLAARGQRVLFLLFCEAGERRLCTAAFRGPGAFLAGNVVTFNYSSGRGRTEKEEVSASKRSRESFCASLPGQGARLRWPGVGGAAERARVTHSGVAVPWFKSQFSSRSTLCRFCRFWDPSALLWEPWAGEEARATWSCWFLLKVSKWLSLHGR